MKDSFTDGKKFNLMNTSYKIKFTITLDKFVFFTDCISPVLQE